MIWGGMAMNALVPEDALILRINSTKIFETRKLMNDSVWTYFLKFTVFNLSILIRLKSIIPLMRFVNFDRVSFDWNQMTAGRSQKLTWDVFIDYRFGQVWGIIISHLRVLLADSMGESLSFDCPRLSIGWVRIPFSPHVQIQNELHSNFIPF